MKNVPAGQRDRDTPPLIYRGGCPGSPKRIFHTQNTLPFMHPNRKTNRPQNPPLTRRLPFQFHGLADIFAVCIEHLRCFRGGFSVVLIIIAFPQFVGGRLIILIRSVGLLFFPLHPLRFRPERLKDLLRLSGNARPLRACDFRPAASSGYTSAPRYPSPMPGMQENK